MKIEQLLVQHFYNNREVTLQGMGTFTLSPDFVAPKENDKEAEIPDNAISFEYNARAVADDTLINYIVQQTRKMKSLAAADLDSYLVLGKQFLNIGKPFKIEGMGLLIKNQQGELEFIKGHSFHTKMENTPAPVAAKEKSVNPDISFASEAKKTEGSNKKGLLIAGMIIGVLLIGATAWYFLGRKNDTSIDNKTLAAAADTSQNSTPKEDTVALKTTPEAPAADGFTFKVVFLQTADSAAAVSRMNVLTARKHKIIMYTKDSLYNLAEPFTLPLSDTAHIKDSLNRYYYSGKAFIQLK
ncbi:MAG: hypothetical protein JNM14_14410 [Ferruginibacter sp.]|nr:hypothetical protein [Ferruginibacter sp.]